MDLFPNFMRKKKLPIAATSLRDELDRLAVKADLGVHAGDAIRCVACAHRCKLKPGQHGLCGVRFNRDGSLFAPHGYVARRYIRPVETNTIFHVHPGARALSFGMFGCDLKCGHCHNWYISQALREDASGEKPTVITAEALIREARHADAKVVCAGFNEPLITTEWMCAVFAEAKKHGLTTAVITDGNSTPEVLEYIRPVTDVFRVDLKAFSDKSYRTLGGRLDPVLDTIKRAHAMGYWIEVVTLIVPGLNDDIVAIREMADFLAGIDPNIPWHLNAGQPRYKSEAKVPASVYMQNARRVALDRGVRYVYTGNLHYDQADSHTVCTQCGARVITRTDYRLTRSYMDGNACGHCQGPIPGLWRTRRIAEMSIKGIALSLMRSYVSWPVDKTAWKTTAVKLPDNVRLWLHAIQKKHGLKSLKEAMILCVMAGGLSLLDEKERKALGIE